MKLINQLIDAKIKIGLLHHQFNGDLTEEKLELRNCKIFKRNELYIEDLRNLEDSELLKIS